MESNGGPSRREFDETKEDIREIRRDYVLDKVYQAEKKDTQKDIDALNKFKDWVFYGFLGAIIVAVGIALVMGALK